MGNLSTGYSYGCCTFGKNCQNYFISISPTGDVYPCGRFDGLNSFNMGNINKNPLQTIINSSIRKKLLKRNPNRDPVCSLCQFVNICNSGCISNGYMTKGDPFDRDYYCPGYKLLFKHIQNRIENEIKPAIIER